jgi:phage repressor protein C with HTH and peptisase S24 domain
MSQAERLKNLRQKTNLNQQEVADKIGKSRSRIAIYETQPQVQIPSDVLQSLSQLYNTTVEYILYGTERPVAVAGPAVNGSSRVTGNDLRILVVTTDRTGEENAAFVPVRARAGYLVGYGDPEFIQTLPTYSIPGFSDGTYRIFEVEGDSMLDTLHPGDLAVTQFVENWRALKHNKIYVLVATDGLLVKRVHNLIDRAGGVVILSDNPQFAPDFLHADQIMEIWEVKAIISRSLEKKNG